MADYRKRVDPPAQYKNMFGDRSEKPMSVQMAEVGVEFTPAGTIFGINDIKEELQKEEPDYYKIGMMAGIEAIGIIPGLGDAAIAAIKAGAKKAGLDKVADQTGVLLNGPKAEDSIKTEIIAGPGAKTYYNRDYDRAKELKEQGYSAAQIEDITGRVETGESTDYLGAIDARYSDLKDIRDDIKLRLSFSDLSPEARQKYEKELLKIEKGLKLRDSQTPGGIRLPENPFKFEIDDSKIEIKNNDGSQTLKESTKHRPIIVRNIIPTHTELFKEYPNLESVEFYVDPDLGTGAHFNPTVGKNGAIVFGSDRTDLSRSNSKRFRNTFFHELQHAAQYQDYKIANLFQLGGSPTQLGRNLVRGSQLKRILPEQNPNLIKLRDEILEIFEAEKGTGALDTTSPGFRLPGTSPNPAKVFGDVDVAKKLARKMRELESELFKSYMRSASETEARLAGRRGQEIATVGSNTKPRITSDLVKERRVETKEEFWSDNPKSDADKKKADIKIKLGPMTNEEVLRYATGAINFARYAKGIDKELQGFSEFGPTKPNFAEGGTVDMNQQMSFAFEDGGLRDDGMEQDPVSGNEVPPGSTAKEVRDDIPAQLSEGEYVVPADVVRYYGVKFFEDLRDRAKMGLQEMEANGRIGGEPVPAGGPMNDDDLSPEEMAAIREMMGMAEGGAVNMYKQQQDLYTAPNQAVGNNMNTGGQVRGYAPGGSPVGTAALTMLPGTNTNGNPLTGAPQNTGQNVEQQILTAGQQAQQNPFTPAPLGSSLFPSSSTKMAEVTTPKTFTPVKMINLQTNHEVVANTQKEFEEYISKGYIVDDGTLKPKGGGSGDGGGGGGGTPTKTEPYKEFVNSVQWNSEKAVMEFINGVNTSPMDKDKSNTRAILGGIVGGIPGAIVGGLSAPGTMEALTNIAQLKATQMVAKAKGMDGAVDAAEKAIAEIIKNSPGVVDKLDDYLATGKNMFAAIEKSEAYQAPTVKPASKGAPKKTASEQAVSDYESLKDTSGGDDDDGTPVVTSKSIAETKAIMDKQETPEAKADTTKNLERTTAKIKDIQSGKNTSGQVGFKEGGLMAKGKKKKK